MSRLWHSSYPWATGLALVLGVVIAVMIDRWQALECEEVHRVGLIPPLGWVLAITGGVGTLAFWRRRRVLAWSLGCGGLTLLVCMGLLRFGSVFACAIG